MPRNLNSNSESDKSARKDQPELPDPGDYLMGEGAQTSNKSGKHSTVEKLNASRPEFGTGAQAKPVDGAHGDVHDHPEPHKGNEGVQGELSDKARRHSQDPEKLTK